MFEGKCHHCVKKGNKTKVCWFNKSSIESNTTTTFDLKENSEDDWDVEAFIVVEQEESTVTNDLIIDSGCSNHMTGDKEKFQNMLQIVVSTNNSNDMILLQNIYHVPCMKKYLLLVAQLISLGHFIMFGPQDVKIYHDLKIKK
ncbi:hypothetical protein H5410_037609 [Solanum commersonii]|uniref:Uncharacterized protein n=1 Tax=Solanum commersonii TaxID=4109 RepID=A0A9J5Y7M4_SOLCO|nr:hypothetical protein H5410_037609 [Solanum commersonii]